MVAKMKQLIVRSMFATKHAFINPTSKLKQGAASNGQTFELFGFDFILDEDFNVWLIEVNTNPCIEESSNILKIYLPRMIDDMLKLSVDKLFEEYSSS